MEICGLARAVEPDLERCYDAVRHAPLHRIHTFLATSDLHLDVKVRITTPPPAPPAARRRCRQRHLVPSAPDIARWAQLKITREECIAQGSRMVKFAKDLGDAHIEFSPEAAGRPDPEFLVDVVRRARPPPAALLTSSSL